MMPSGIGAQPLRDDAGPTFFDAHYFATGCGRPYERDEEWLRFFSGIAQRIVADMQPASVLDAGCAMGFLVEALRDRGVAAEGVDISEYAISQVRPDIAEHCWVGSLADPLPRRYDLIVSIEVLEHMPPAEADRAIENICQQTDDVLFSSTPLDYKEATHLNVRMPEAWAETFARHGFFRDVDYDASYITPWAARFRRNAEPTHRLVRDYERRFWQLWKERVDLRHLALELRHELVERYEAQRAAEQALERLSSPETEGELAALRAERDALRQHLSAIEQGRVMRLLNALHRLRRRWR